MVSAVRLSSVNAMRKEVLIDEWRRVWLRLRILPETISELQQETEASQGVQRDGAGYKGEARPSGCSTTEGPLVTLLS
jgi:hypothetical protein